MVVKKLSGLLLGMSLLIVANGSVYAHGGVSVDRDTCIMKIDQWLMHFTGYQPMAAGGEEFCEDIPFVGKAIIVLDYVDPQLRKFKAAFKMLQKDTWDAAMTEVGDEQAKVIVDTEAKYYRKGSIQIEHDFTEPGYFIGFVTMTDAENGKSFVSRFPFAVGYGKPGNMQSYLMIGGSVLLALGAFWFFFLRSTKDDEPVAT